MEESGGKGEGDDSQKGGTGNKNGKIRGCAT